MEYEPIIYDEDILLKKLQDGNRESYRFIFQTYHKILCLYATGLTHDKSLAEDIVQNVFLNLWAKRDSLSVRASLKNYLFKSVYHIFVNEFRKKRKEEDILEKIHYETLQKSIEDEELSIRKRLEWINKEIDILPPKSKEIFVMHKKRGLSYLEIAQILGISVNTVESHIGRALKRIRNRTPKPFFS
ncbi:MAG: RNA polymerase sigma-70 factor [Maribacter sp.]|nr:MAG: RNA polymerase sigma-70 factor [Maribacter sp.]